MKPSQLVLRRMPKAERFVVVWVQFAQNSGMNAFSTATAAVRYANSIRSPWTVTVVAEAAS